MTEKEYYKITKLLYTMREKNYFNYIEERRNGTVIYGKRKEIGKNNNQNNK